MHISNLPIAIRDIQLQLVDIEGASAHIRFQILEIEAIVDGEIAFNLELRNEKQRDAKRFEALRVHAEYRKLQEILSEYNLERGAAIAELEYLRNEFAVLKLTAKQAIASNISGLELIELETYLAA